jgi:hypothetical protein
MLVRDTFVYSPSAGGAQMALSILLMGASSGFFSSWVN